MATNSAPGSQSGTLVYPKMWQAWVVVLTAALYFFYNFVQMNMFNTLSPSLEKELGFTVDQIGKLASYYALATAAFVIPAGMIIDRLSVKKILLTVFAVMVVASYVFSATSSFFVMCIARIIIGFAAAFALIQAIKLATRWFDPRHIALAIGMAVTLGMLGGMFAQVPLTIMVNTFGWRHALQFFAVFGVVVLAIIAVVVRDYPPGGKEAFAKLQGGEKTGFWKSLGMVIANPQNWLCGVYISLVNLPLFTLGCVWNDMFLTQIHGLTQMQAANVTMMMFAGMMVGSPLFGWVSDRWGRRRAPMILGAVLSLAALLVVVYVPSLSFNMWMVVNFLLGLFMGFQCIGYSMINESNPSNISSTATGLASAFILSAGSLNTVFSWLLDFSGDGKVVDGIQVRSLGDYRLAMLLVVGCLVVAIIASLLTKETYCKLYGSQGKK